jgi:hypothetical protein
MASIRRMPWQAIVRRKGYRPQFRTFASQPDAKQWARQVESEIDRAVFVDRGPSERVTLAELIDRYIGEVLPGKKSSASLTRCPTFLRRNFGVFTLAALQPKDVSAYRDARIASGRAGATVVKELNCPKARSPLRVASRHWPTAGLGHQRTLEEGRSNPRGRDKSARFRCALQRPEKAQKTVNAIRA